MKINKSATSIVEAIIAIIIITTWIIWLYDVYDASLNLEKHIDNKMTATSIAREWLEAVTNIRDTNWIILWSDIDNCWNTLNYNPLCVLDNTFTYDIKEWWHYIVYRNANHRWILEEKTLWTYDYNNATYRSNYGVWIDSDWFYTQTWTTNNMKHRYTREIVFRYIDTNWNWFGDSNDQKVKVSSIVQWLDPSSSNEHKVELSTILWNRKK
jgi:hypothetical protein